jgi:hypothetical protein
VVQCQDKAQSIVEAKGVEKAQAQMESCANDCAKFYVSELNSLAQKLMKEHKP